MRTTLSPAGKQPVRIATSVAFGTDINVGSKPAHANLAKTPTSTRALLTAASICAVAAMLSAIDLSVAYTSGSAYVLGASTLIGMAALCLSSYKKGGEA